jgi:hypothetical protein
VIGKAGGRSDDDDGTTRLLVEKGHKRKPSPEEQDQEDKRTSKLQEFITAHGGKGRAKIYRVVDGDPLYATTFVVDEDFIDNVEEKLAELGGGKYYVKLYWGAKCETALPYFVDPLSHPTKKTPAEERREGGAMPQTPAEFQAFMTNTITGALQPILAAIVPRQDGGQIELLKTLLVSQQEQSTRLLEATLGARHQAGDHKSMLRDVAETITLVDAVRGGSGAARSDEKRSLAMKFLDGPLTKAAERAADRVIDKYMPEDEAPEKAAPARALPRRAAPPASAPPPAPPPAPPAAAQRPVPPLTPTTPIHPPRGVKPMAAGELAKMAHASRASGGRVPRATEPAPRAAEVLPKAVKEGGG